MDTIGFIRHKPAYEFWRANHRNAKATGAEFSRTDETIAKWRDEESWIHHADKADAADAAKYVQTHEQRKAEALAVAYDAVQVMLVNAGKMQVQIMERLATGQADAMDIGAAGSYAAKAIACADTLYSISKLNVDVTQHTSTDVAQVAERLYAAHPELRPGAQA